MKLTSNRKNNHFLTLSALVVAPTAIAVVDMPDQQVFAATMIQNAPSTATPAVDPLHVYVSSKESNSSNSGNGSAQNPYNRFEDAVAHVEDGGTIYIDASAGAFLNAQDEGGTLPFILDKNVTIKPAHGAGNAELDVRAAGIILGADVKFENITLSFANKYHDSIFANGYRLDLINVTRNDSSRKIDLFTGGLHLPDAPDTPIYPSGTKGVIHVETNKQFAGGLPSTFGNIYAGSMNGIFKGDSEITVNNIDNAKKIDMGAIYASGAHEAKAGDMFDLVEPEAPAADPAKFSTKRDVAIHLHNNTIAVDGTTGSDAVTSVTASTVYPTNMDLQNIHHLTIASGEITPLYNDSMTTIPRVTLQNGGTLNLTTFDETVTVQHYDGDGIVTLKQDGQLHISNTMEGTLTFKSAGVSNIVDLDHVYVITPTDGLVSFVQSDSQRNIELVSTQTDTGVEWQVVKTNAQALTPLTSFSIAPENAMQTLLFEELNIDGSGYAEIPFSVQVLGDEEVYLDDYPIEITVNGKVADYYDGDYPYYYLADENLSMFFAPGEKENEHYFIIEGQTEDGELTEIALGSYEFNVSYMNDDGTIADFTANLHVVDELKAGTSTVQMHVADISTWGSRLTIPVVITQDIQDAGEGYVSLQVNGHQIEQQEMTGAEQFDVLFEQILIHEANHFQLGDNELTVTYSGTDNVTGASASQTVNIQKAEPLLTLQTAETSYEETYDGTAKSVAAAVKVEAAGKIVTDYESVVLYKDASQTDAVFTEAPPVLPGVYETKIVVLEGASYARAEIAGPTLTINRAKPTIQLTGKVKDSMLTVTAQLTGPTTGDVELSINGETVIVPAVDGIATYTTADSGLVSLYEVTAKYVETPLYETAESLPIQIEVHVTGVALHESNFNLTIDETATLQAIVRPLNATNPAVVWHSDNEAVATVTQDGTVTAHAAGTALITVTTVDGSYEASAVVQVAEKIVPPTDNGDDGDQPESPTDNGDGEQQPEPPIDNGDGEQQPEPPIDNGDGEQQPEPPTDNGENEKDPELPIDNGEDEKEPELPTDNGEGENQPEPPTDNGEGEKEPELPTDNGGGEKEPELPTDNGEDEKEPELPTDNGEDEKEPELPTDNGDGEEQPEPPTDNSGGEKEPELPTDNGESEKDPELPTNNGEDEKEPELPTDNGDGEKEPELPTDNGEGEQEPDLPIDNGEDEQEPESTTENGEDEKEPELPTNNEEAENQSNDSTDREDDKDTSSPSTVNPTRPSSSGGSGGGGSARPNTPNTAVNTPPSEPVDAAPAQQEFKVNVEQLEQSLKEKVDSIVASVTTQSEQSVQLSFGGDADDLQHVTAVTINKDGIFITVDGEQLNITGEIPATLDLTNVRVIRYVNNELVPVMHRVDGEDLHITSSQLHNIVLLPKVEDPFDDVAEDAWYQHYVEEMYNYGFTQGTTATTYSPSDDISRAQFAVMIARALELSGMEATNSATLSDVEGQWYASEIQLLADLGIVTGHADGTFKGEQPLTRQQAVVLLARALEVLGVDVTSTAAAMFDDSASISPYAQQAVNFLANNGVLVSGEGVAFNPHETLTRAQMAKILIEGLRLSGKY